MSRFEDADGCWVIEGTWEDFWPGSEEYPRLSSCPTMVACPKGCAEIAFEVD